MDTRSTQPDQFGWEDERISAYLDGELTASEQAQFEKELSQSSELNQLVEELRIVRQQLETLPQHKLASDFANDVLIRAAHQILADAQQRPESSSSESSISDKNGVANLTDHKSVTAASPVASARLTTGASRNLRPLIWSTAALAAGLMLLITNSDNTGRRDESVALYSKAGDRVLMEERENLDQAREATRETEEFKKAIPNEKFYYHDAQPNSTGRKADIAKLSKDASMAEGVTTSPPSEKIAPLPRASGPSDRRDAAMKKGDARGHNGTLSEPIAKMDALPKVYYDGNGIFDNSSAPPAPSADSDFLSKVPDVVSKESAGLGGRARNAPVQSGFNRNTIVQPESPAAEEMFVVQMTCAPKTIKNRSFDKLLQENQISITNANEASPPTNSVAKKEPEESNTNVMRKGRVKPLLKAPSQERLDELALKNSAEGDEKPIAEDKKSKQVHEFAHDSKDVEVVMIEMDRNQFDRLMSEVCNKTEDYANVQVAQAPSQSRFDLLGNFTDFARYADTSPLPPSQLDVKPYDVNSSSGGVAQNPLVANSAPNAQPSTTPLPGANELNNSNRERSFGNPTAKSSSGTVPNAPPLSQSIAAQGVNSPNSSSVPSANLNWAYRGGAGGNAQQSAPASSQNAIPENGSIVSSQPALQSPPTSNNQFRSGSNGLNFFSNSQLIQSSAAQRLEFAGVDNKNLKEATQNRYAAKPASGIGNSTMQLSAKLGAKQDAAGASPSGIDPNSNNLTKSNSIGTQQTQPLMKAPAPPASMSQSVVPDYGVVSPNSTQSLARGKVPRFEANDSKKIASGEQGKSESANSGASIPGKASGKQDTNTFDVDGRSDAVEFGPNRKELAKKPENVQKKLELKDESVDEDIVSNERSNQQAQTAQQGQGAQQAPLAKDSLKSKSEQFGQQSQQFNSQQAPLSKPSSTDYAPYQQQIANQRGNQGANQQQQQQQSENFYAFQPQQQQFGIINNQANGRVRAVFILQKKPTQDLNSESVERNLSK